MQSLRDWSFRGRHFLTVLRGSGNYIRLHATHREGRHVVETKKTPAFLQSTTSVDGLVNEPENITEIPGGEREEPYEARKL